MDNSGTLFQTLNYNEMDTSSCSDSDLDDNSGKTLSVLQGVENALQHHLDNAATIVQNRTHQMRSWQVRLRSLIIKQNDGIIDFLEKPMLDWPSSTQRNRFLKALNISAFHTNQEWFRQNVEPIVDTSIILKQINDELGTSIDDMQTNILRIMDKYKITVSNLFQANESLQKKLTTIDNLQKQLEQFYDLGKEDNESSSLTNLQISILEYAQHKYDSLHIQKDYTDFCNEYAKFCAYRSILSPLQTFADHTSTLGGPVCSICTLERINSTLIPCGHTFCNTCSVKQRSQCYICRSSIREKQKIYFM